MKLKFEKVRNILVESGEITVSNRKKEVLGTIYYDDEWKEWIWEQESDIKMSAGCLHQVTDKLEELEIKGFFECA
jgi:hypothetical protein